MDSWLRTRSWILFLPFVALPWPQAGAEEALDFVAEFLYNGADRGEEHLFLASRERPVREDHADFQEWTKMHCLVLPRLCEPFRSTTRAPTRGN